MAPPPKKGWLPFKPTAITKTKPTALTQSGFTPKPEPEPKHEPKNQHEHDEPESSPMERVASEEPSQAAPARRRLHNKRESRAEDDEMVEQQLRDDTYSHLPPSCQQAQHHDADDGTGGKRAANDKDEDYMKIFSRRREVGTPFFHETMAHDGGDGGDDDGDGVHGKAKGKGKGKDHGKGTNHGKGKDPEKGKGPDKSKDDHGKSDDDGDEWTPSTRRQGKRRRVLNDDDDDDYNGEAVTVAQSPDKNGLMSPSSPSRPPSKARKTRLSTAPRDSKASPCIVIDAADPFTECTPPLSTSPLAPQASATAPAAAASPPPPSPPSSPPLSPAALDPELQKYVERAQSSTVARSKQDERAMQAMVIVYVTTRIPCGPDEPPGGVTLGAKLRLNNKLKVLRNVWFKKFAHRLEAVDGLEEGDIILTWREQRLYEFNTLYSLGIRPDDDLGLDRDDDGCTPPTRVRHVDPNNDGTVSPFSKSSNPNHGFIRNYTQVHLEAWTRDLWEAHQEQQRQQIAQAESMPSRSTHRHGSQRQNSNTNPSAPSPQASSPAGAKDNNNSSSSRSSSSDKITVTLLPKDLPPLEVRTTLSTTMERLAGVFRQQRALPPGATVVLMFDGLRAEESYALDELGIDDGDTIQVYIK